MAYSKTIDERYYGSFLQYDAGALDAPSTLNEVAVLADGSTGYGFLTDTHTLRDIDIYSLGILDAGDYSVDVDGYTWDYTEFGYGSVSKFQVLNSYGSVVDTSYGTYSNIDFTVAASSTYYVKIEGPLFGTEQYSVSYTKTGELASTNTPAVFSGASITGDHEVGQTLTANMTYSDANGISGATPIVYWYAGTDPAGYGKSNTYTLTENEVGKNIFAIVSFNDDSGNLEVSEVFGGRIVVDVNNAPTVSTSTSLTTDEDTATAAIAFSGSDPDGDTLTYRFSDPAKGSVVNNGDGTFTYTPDANANGSDSFTLTANDGTVDVEATISVTINAVNDAPTVSTSTSLTTNEDTATAAIAFSGSDPDGDTLTFSFSDPAKGSVVNNGNGTFTYTPDANANGSDSFTLTANDGTVDVEETISVTVNAVNDAPTDSTLNLNSTPTGAVTISGTAIVGNTLTAVTSAISDDDGLGDFSYQWLQEGIEIVGATAGTFLVTQDVVGGDISVAASYIDGAGNFESLTSLTIDNVGIAFDPDLTETYTIPVLHFLNDDSTGEYVVKFIANSFAQLELFDNPAFDYSYSEYNLAKIDGDLSSIRITYGDETFAFDGSKFSFYDSANPYPGQGKYSSSFFIGRSESDDYYYDIGSFGFGRDDMGIEKEGLLILLGSDDPTFADGAASEITDQASFDEYLLSIKDDETLIPADVSYGPGQAGLLNAIITEILSGTSESDEFEFALMEQGGHGYIALRDFDSLEDELVLTSYTPSKIIKTLDGSGYDKFVFTEDSDLSTLVIESAEVASSLKLSNLANNTLKLASGDLLVNEHGELSLSSTKEIDGVKVDGISSFKTDIKLADDTNASDPISIGDVIAQIKHIIGMKELKSYAHEAGDTNNDGDVNLTDVLATIKHIIGREELNTFDLVTDNGFAVNALDAESKGNLKLVINGDADQSHADWDILASLPL